MGANKSLIHRKRSVYLLTQSKLTNTDIKFIIKQTGYDKEKIITLFEKYIEYDSHGKLIKPSLMNLYCELQPEPTKKIDIISQLIFSIFEQDHHGFRDLQDFMIVYALAASGETVEKISYVFDLYDMDENGYLDEKELNYIILTILKCLDPKMETNPKAFAKQCLEKLDIDSDGQVSKEEFVNGLLEDKDLRSLLLPFV